MRKLKMKWIILVAIGIIMALGVNALCLNPLELFCIFSETLQPVCEEKQTIEEVKIIEDIPRVRNFAILCPLNVTSKFINNITGINTTFIQTIFYQCDVVAIPYLSTEITRKEIKYVNETICT